MLPKILMLWISICITLTLVGFAAAADPYPGMSCNWAWQCNTNQTRLKCRGFNAPPVCICEAFMADAKYNVTSVPEYSEEQKMCVVKKGSPCLLAKAEIECEPKTWCDPNRGPSTKLAGLCTVGTGGASGISITISFFAMLLVSFAVAFFSRL